MKSEQEIKRTLREWIAKKGKLSSEEITDQTPFLEEGIINSIQLMELILFIEDLTGNSIDVKSLRKGMLHDVDTIYKNFVVRAARLQEF
jgi:acyl carrier protein